MNILHRFSPVVFLYLCSVVPAIWFLELDLLQKRISGRELIHAGALTNSSDILKQAYVSAETLSSIKGFGVSAIISVHYSFQTRREFCRSRRHNPLRSCRPSKDCVIITDRTTNLDKMRTNTQLLFKLRHIFHQIFFVVQELHIDEVLGRRSLVVIMFSQQIMTCSIIYWK